MSAREAILARLAEMGIECDLVAHPPVHSIEDCQLAESLLGGLVPKNLLLTPRNRSAFVLCLVMPDAVFRTGDVSKQLGLSRLSFAPDADLSRLLRTYPSALSPLGLIFPEAAAVRVAIDERLRDVPRLLFHPNENTASLAMSGSDFFNHFLPQSGHSPAWIHVAP